MNVVQALQDEKTFVLRVVQPALVGLIDGTVSTLAPIFATAFLAGSHAALLVGLATAIGAGISMGLSEGLSDDGTLTGRGPGRARGAITGLATTLGGTFHALPFMIPDRNTAVVVASWVVSCELLAIAYVRKRFMAVSWRASLLQVTGGGVLVTAVGFLIGNA